MPCLTKLLVLSSPGSGRVFSFTEIQKNSSNFIQINSCLNRNSISVFCASWQRNNIEDLAYPWFCYLAAHIFLLAIQNPRLKTGYLSYKSDFFFFVIFFQIYRIIPVITHHHHHLFSCVD